MRIAYRYSHLNGEEFLIARHEALYLEIEKVIGSIDAETYRTKESQEKKTRGQMLFSPTDLNAAFKRAFGALAWKESRYDYFITLNRSLLDKSILIPSLREQQQFLIDNGEPDPIKSYNQTDFIKNKIAIEVQFGKYAFVAYDLFVKHMLFYSGGKIDLGIEILPTKRMSKEMSSGIGYYEGEVYNVMRQGRISPPVPLLILGIEP